MKQELYCISEFVFGVVLFCSQFGGLAASSEEIVHSASCQMLEPGFDIATDNDIGKAFASEPSQCCAICEKTNECRAWAWNIAGPTCYLKSATNIVPARDTTTRAGLLGDIATCSLHQGFDIAPGNDLAWHRAQSPTDCCGICAAIPECKAWSHNVSPPRCYLKTSTELVPARDDTTVAGIVREEADNPNPNPAENEIHGSDKSDSWEDEVLDWGDVEAEAGPAPV